MRCVKCGSMNDTEAKFCKNCGSKLQIHSMAYQEINKDKIIKENKKLENQNRTSFLDNKVLIGSILVILLIAGGCCGFILLQPHYKEINIIGVTMEVPTSDSNVTIKSNDSQNYIDDKNNVKIYGLDSSKIGLFNIFDTIKFSEVHEINKEANKELIHIDGISINKTKNGTYSFYTNFNNKNIFIITKDKNTIIHIIKTMKLNSLANTEENQNNDSENNIFNIPLNATFLGDMDNNHNNDNNENDVNEDNNNNINNNNLKILGGEISTGSSISSKTKAHINLGKNNAGKQVKITAKYLCDGKYLNNGNILTRTVDSDGYVSFPTDKGFDRYPDTVEIYIYDNNMNIIDKKTVLLETESGTQSF